MKIQINGVIDTDELGLVLYITKESMELLCENRIVSKDYFHNGEYKLISPLDMKVELEPELDMKVSVGVVEEESIEEFVSRWRELFPKGLNSNGYAYRGDKNACVSKMRKFIKENKADREEIIKATEYALKKFSLKGYDYMPQCHYFISKSGVSLLSQYLVLVKENPNYKEVSEERTGSI